MRFATPLHSPGKEPFARERSLQTILPDQESAKDSANLYPELTWYVGLLHALDGPTRAGCGPNASSAPFLGKKLLFRFRRLLAVVFLQELLQDGNVAVEQIAIILAEVFLKFVQLLDRFARLPA